MKKALSPRHDLLVYPSHERHFKETITKEHKGEISINLTRSDTRLILVIS